MKGRRLYAALMVVVCMPLVWAEQEMRPAVQEVHRQVKNLGAEEYEERQKAHNTLEKWSSTYPRFMLVLLAESYSKTEDMEVIFRLKELLYPLAMTHLFNNSQGYLGVNLSPGPPYDGQPTIRFDRIQDGTAAQRDGLKDADLLAKVDDRAMADLGGVQEFSRYIAERPPGSVVELLIVRQERERLITVTLQQRPENTFRFSVLREQQLRKYEQWLTELRPMKTGGIPEGHHPSPADAEPTGL